MRHKYFLCNKPMAVANKQEGMELRNMKHGHIGLLVKLDITSTKRKLTHDLHVWFICHKYIMTNIPSQTFLKQMHQNHIDAVTKIFRKILWKIVSTQIHLHKFSISQIPLHLWTFIILKGMSLVYITFSYRRETRRFQNNLFHTKHFQKLNANLFFLTKRNTWFS